MSDSTNQFERFREEHTRLHDPALRQGAVELVPTSWNEVTSEWSKRSKTGKKKLWKELVRLAEQSTAETLLPAAFIEGLRWQSSDTQANQRTQPKPKAAVRVTDDDSDESAITIEPRSVSCDLGLFQERGFALSAPAARDVELVWLAEGGSSLQRAVMDHKHEDRFEGQVGLLDGSYLFAYAVDGYLRPDPRQAHRIIINQLGVFAPLKLARQQQIFVVTNRGAGDESLLLETSAEWLLPETGAIDLEAGESARITARFDMRAMNPGLNETLLRVSVRRGEELVPAGTVHIAVRVEVAGAVPEFVFDPGAFGEVKQGMAQLELRVMLSARGRGPLTGMISLPHSGELADFKLSADDPGSADFEHTFQIDSAKLPQPQPHQSEAALRVMVLSDSFLANYRLSEFDIPYRLVYLRKSLPALSFGTVRVGGTKTMRLDVTRSDGGEIDLAVALPTAVQNYLEAYPAHSGTYVFRFDAGRLPPGASIVETVELIDRNSGLRSQIKVLGAVAPAAGESTHTAVN